MTSSKGFTLVEVLVATILLGIISLGIATSMGNFLTDYSRSRNTAARNRYLNSIISIIQVRISQLDVSFDQTASIDKNINTFPYYWAADYELATNEECTTKYFKGTSACPLLGRMNYLVKPVPGVPNLFETSIYFYHPELNAGQTREFTYFLSVK